MRTNAKDINLFDGGQVDLSVKNGGLFVLPVKKKYSLIELIEGITDDNLLSEIDTGSPQGEEFW
ncbi:hypothetical protein QUF70_06545 [Desulfobacterales bacterium HSG17]|nr:hypothetical protein [Desulfobacterales bacterium HSG17]